MKDRFWLYMVLFSAVFVTVVALGGFYLLTLQESQKSKMRIKKSLSRQNAFYLRELDKHLVHFIGEAEKILQRQETDNSSLFSALVLIDLKTGSVKPVFLPSVDSEKVVGDFLQFADTIKQKIIRKPFLFHFLPSRDGRKGWVVFVAPPQTFSQSQGLRWAGLVRSEDLFTFSEASDREALIINSQGRLFFSIQPKSALALSKPVLGMFLKNRNKRKTAGWYVRRRGGSSTGNNLFHVKPWPETNLFVISGERLSQPLFAWTDLSGPWLFFCLFLGIFLFFGLFLIIQPLFSAYGALRNDMIHFARTGRKPSLSKSTNPFLYFYNELISTKGQPLSENVKNPTQLIQTFQDLLKEEEQRLKKRFPGFILKTKLETSVNLDQFYKFMKKILHELLLNAIEAMGSMESQEIIVSTWKEEEAFILSVRDQGPGLSETEKRKVFELYHSTKSHLGVGLNVVKSIVSSHGGSVKLISFAEGGLEIQVYLPKKCFSQTQHGSPSFPHLIKDGRGIELRDKKPFSSPPPRAFH